VCLASVSQGGAERGWWVLGPPPALTGHFPSWLDVETRENACARSSAFVVTDPREVPLGAVRLDACFWAGKPAFSLKPLPRFVTSCCLVNFLVFLTPPDKSFSIRGIVLNCYFYSC